MRSHLADLVRLFILLNLLVMALYTIPAHGPEHNTAVHQDQHKLNGNYVTVTDMRSINQAQGGY